MYVCGAVFSLCGVPVWFFWCLFAWCLPRSLPPGSFVSWQPRQATAVLALSLPLGDALTRLLPHVTHASLPSHCSQPRRRHDLFL